MFFLTSLFIPLFLKNKVNHIIPKQSLSLTKINIENNEINDCNCIESWDDGEVEWEFESLNNNIFKNNYNEFHNFNYNYESFLKSHDYYNTIHVTDKYINTKNTNDYKKDDIWDDGEVEWDLYTDIKDNSIVIKNTNLNIQTYPNNFGIKGDSDSEKIWLFLEKIKNNEINTIVKELYSLLFTTDNLFYDITNIEEKTTDFQIFIALLTFFTCSNTNNKLILRKKFKTSVTLSFIILLILTRGVRSAS